MRDRAIKPLKKKINNKKLKTAILPFIKKLHASIIPLQTNSAFVRKPIINTIAAEKNCTGLIMHAAKISAGLAGKLIGNHSINRNPQRKPAII